MLKARTVGKKPAAVVAEVEASAASGEDTDEESDSNFGVIDYFVTSAQACSLSRRPCRVAALARSLGTTSASTATGGS